MTVKHPIGFRDTPVVGAFMMSPDHAILLVSAGEVVIRTTGKGDRLAGPASTGVRAVA